MAYKALIGGTSGLVGKNCLQFLLRDNDCEQVISIGRREIDVKHDKLNQQIVDFNELDKHAKLFEVEKVYCCLGTTIKVAGSKENFRKVDYEYPLKMAELAEQGLASVFSIVTAQGANSNAPFFYNKVKGEVEDALKALQIEKINVIQPSLLIGAREESRIGESVAQGVFKFIAPAFVGPMKKYKGITVEQVARAMVTIANDGPNGYHKYSSDMLWNY